MDPEVKSKLVDSIGYYTGREDENFTNMLFGSKEYGYIEGYNPHSTTMDLLADVYNVLVEYADHLPLTIRQVYYRLIGEHGYAKGDKLYTKLSRSITSARRAQHIPFEHIRDDSVTMLAGEYYNDAEHFKTDTHDRIDEYRRDVLNDQPLAIELWCESAGMLPQLRRVADDYCVPVHSSGGYNGVSVNHAIAERALARNKGTVILHLGDYDPSGVSIFLSLSGDSCEFAGDGRVIPIRAALTDSDID